MVFAIEPKCLNSTQLGLYMGEDVVRVNVAVQFSWVITLLLCDAGAIWREGIRIDHEGEE